MRFGSSVSASARPWGMQRWPCSAPRPRIWGSLRGSGWRRPREPSTSRRNASSQIQCRSLWKQPSPAERETRSPWRRSMGRSAEVTPLKKKDVTTGVKAEGWGQSVCECVCVSEQSFAEYFHFNHLTLISQREVNPMVEPSFKYLKTTIWVVLLAALAGVNWFISEWDSSSGSKC